MTKLNELFVDNINKAITSADVMSDINKKPIAYATIAQAIAIYLNKNSSSLCDNTDNNIVDNSEEWKLPYDENGVPYLNEEDFSDPDKVLAYNNALIEKTSNIENINNEEKEEDIENITKENKKDIENNTNKEEIENKINDYKDKFNYNEDPSCLDNLYCNFTNGVYNTLNEADENTLEPFVYFLDTELKRAQDELVEWQNSWIGKEGLDKLIAEAYQDENATIETHINCSNIFQFLSYVSLYNANSWLESYKQQFDNDTLNNYAKKYLDNSNVTIEDINESNIVGFVYFIQKSLEETA